MSIEIINKFSDIVFDPEPHTYTRKGELYQSVTTMIHSYTQEFDGKTIAERKSNKTGIPAEEYLTTWTINKEYSCVLGTELHFYIETFLKYDRKIETITGIEERVQAFHEFWSKYKEILEFVGSEVVLYDEKARLAGTIDCLVKNKKTGAFVVLDWKSNKEIKYNNEWQNMKFPLEHLEDCNFNHYSIQLATYTEILKRNFPEMVFEESRIVYFPKGGTYKIIRTKDLEAEAKILIEKREKEYV